MTQTEIGRSIAVMETQIYSPLTPAPTSPVGSPITQDDPIIASGPFDPDIASEEPVFVPIARWAKERPTKTALIAEGISYTYSELESATNRWARALVNLGVRKGDRVALVVRRGPDAVLALISILKTGAGYIPLDADSPTDHIATCVDIAGARFVLVDREVAPGGWSADTVTLDNLAERAAFCADAPLDGPEFGPTCDDLAYAIFTSGTTGRPKGVPISHRSLTNFVRGNQAACMQLTADDRVLQAFSPASDGHHEEIWPTFLVGATLIVANSDTVHSGALLESFLNNHKVTVVSCAPTLLSLVEGDVPTLRKILFGAERLPDEMVERWWSPNREIINTYGPTEATVGATFGICKPGEPITIGSPLPNTYCLIVDEHINPVDPGEEGELCISGIGVSVGYLGDSSLSAGRFVPNPFNREGLHNGLLYRSGDRVRQLSTGEISWLGRIDGQVKIRGFRIELSDIENRISADDALRGAVVVLRGEETGAPYLVGLVVPRPNHHFRAAECMERLRHELPAQMVPRRLEAVEGFPQLPSGKVDRRSASRMVGTPLLEERIVVAPRTHTERAVLAIWAEMFDRTDISVSDDFFTDLGGHSLLAARFVSRLRGELPTASVLDIYEQPTAEAFASLLDARAAGERSGPSDVPAFEPIPPARYRKAVLAQSVGLLALFGLKLCYWLAPFVTVVLFGQLGWSHASALLAGLTVHVLSVPMGLLTVVALKWMVVGRFTEGETPMWGSKFVRWWFVQRLLDFAPKDYITGTPLAAVFLRLLGAKVGQGVTIDSLDLDCPDLIEIGDNCIIEPHAWVRCAQVSSGKLTMGRIRIGAGCRIGTRTGVAGGATLGTGVFLRDLTSVGANVSVPEGEEWHGSPGRPTVRTAPAYNPSACPSKSKRFGFGSAQAFLLVILALIDVLPFAVASLFFYHSLGGPESILAAPALTVSMILVVCAQVLLIKWLVLGKLRPGRYSTTGHVSLRKWFTDKHLDMQKDTLMPIYDSLYVRPWCVALGMQCGPRTEIALPARVPYDLITLGEENFVASDTSLGASERFNGEMVMTHTVTGRRVFLGNNSVIPQGTHLPDNTLLGALSVAPAPNETSQQPGHSYLGSPAFRMPNRQHFDQYNEAATYAPPMALKLERLARESIRIVLPSLALMTVAVMLVKGFVTIWNASSLFVAVLASPILYLLAVVVGVLTVRAAKAWFVGKYTTSVQPLWSRRVWNTETFSVFFHDFGAALFVSLLQGTPYLNAFLRFMGAKIGKRVFLDTTDLTEFEMLDIGDDAAINYNAPLQAHLFEDRVMKIGKITIGPRCSVGIFSVILFETKLEAESQVGDISLVMKGETLPAKTRWIGAPARSYTRRS